MGWRDEAYRGASLYQVLRDDRNKVLGCIMRFYEEDAPTYAIVYGANARRLGPQTTDQQAREAVERAVGT